MTILIIVLITLIALTIYILSCIFCYHLTRKVYLTGKLGEPDLIDIMNIFLPILHIIVILRYIEELEEENDTIRKFLKIESKH